MMNKYYTATHEWIDLKQNIATIGITAFAQKELGEIVYIQLPKIQSVVKAGDQIAVLESTKAASDLYCPISGEVIEVNGAFETKIALINQDPEGSGWLFKLRCTNLSELAQFMTQDEYLRMIG